MMKNVHRAGFDIEGVRDKLVPPIEELLRFPFDSARKRMTTVVVYPEGTPCPTETGYNKRLHMKGASEIVLECCDHFLDGTGEKK
jgi:magnesium-transporting ATPase (P-type)